MHFLPQWLLDVGALAGLLTLALTALRWLFAGFPHVEITPGERILGELEIYATNVDARSIAIINIEIFGQGVRVMRHDESTLATIYRVKNDPIAVVLPKDARQGWHVMIPEEITPPWIVGWVRWQRLGTLPVPNMPVPILLGPRRTRRLIHASRIRSGG